MIKIMDSFEFPRKSGYVLFCPRLQSQTAWMNSLKGKQYTRSFERPFIFHLFSASAETLFYEFKTLKVKIFV